MKILYLAIMILMSYAANPTYGQQESILQPIAFSHETHAGVNQIPCQYCHFYARRSASSGVPSVSSCIGCHGTNELKLLSADIPEAEKLRNYWDQQRTIPWKKIHDIPDFVRFPHHKHVNANPNRFIPNGEALCSKTNNPRSLACQIQLFKQGGDSRCVSCHGDVKTMDAVQLVDPDFATMKWCMDCHLQVSGAKEQKSVLNFLQAWFHPKEDSKKRLQLLKQRHPAGYSTPNLTDCLSCHY